MLIITFLQQEFVLIPEFQGFDLVGEDTRAEILDKWKKWRWVSFLLAPTLLFLRLLLVSGCLFIGSFFFAETNGNGFEIWWTVAMLAQSVLLGYSVVFAITNLGAGINKAFELVNNTSLLFLCKDSSETWVRMPLAAINVFEILYWIVMSLIVGKYCSMSFGKSFRFVMSTYGVGYLFYISIMMFLMLYLT